MPIRNILRIEVRDGFQWINRITPNPSPLTIRQRPKFFQSGRIRKVRPKITVANNPSNSGSRDVPRNRFLPYDIEALCSIEDFEIPVLVKMLGRTSHVVNLAHHVMVTGANKQFGLALELLLSLSGIRQDEAVYATAVLVKPIEHFRSRTCLRVDVQRPKEPPRAAKRWRRSKRVKIYPEFDRLAEHHRRQSAGRDETSTGLGNSGPAADGRLFPHHVGFP